MSKQRALGKGIGALLGGGDEEGHEPSSVVEVPLSALLPNPHQPRREFSQNALAELAESIRKKGVLQPILVEATGPGSYTIVAGERRVRAARIAGLEKIPVLVRQFSRQERLEIALIENIQREDLTPIEEALAYKELMESGGLSQEEVAAQVGKDRSTVANSIRLLKLPTHMQEAIDRETLTAGHARAILTVVNPADQQILFERIQASGMSVREAEAMAQELNRGKRLPGKARKETAGQKRKEPEIREIEEQLIQSLGTRVEIKGTTAKGRIEIEYFSSDDLERVMEIIQGKPQA